MTSPAVTIAIVTYNSADVVDTCFQHVRAQDFQDFEVIVVDNASLAGPPSLPEDARFRLIRLSENTGFAAANNLAARAARAPWLVTLNPDAFPQPDWLGRLLDAVRARPEAGMAGSLQLRAGAPDTLDGAGDCYSPLGYAWRGLYGRAARLAPATGEAFAPCAAAAIYRLDIFRALGGFDEDFFCYYEDVDLAFRFRLAGWRCVQSAEARVAHVGAGSTRERSDFAAYHGARNRTWTFFQNMPPLLLGLLTLPHILFAALLATRTGNAAWRGFCDALRQLPKAWRKRRRIAAARRLSSFAIAPAFTWSIAALLAGAHDVRPWRASIRRPQAAAAAS